MIPERKKIVEQIFRDTADNGMGQDRIVRRLNKAGVPPFGNAKAWGVSYVERLLKNPAVIGIFVPKTRPTRNKRVPSDTVIPNYYPRAISDDLFYRAQAAKKQRRTYMTYTGRQGHGVSNLFSGLVICGTCGQKMRFENKMNARGKRFICQTIKRGIETGCYRGGWNYNFFELSFLAFVREVDLSKVVQEGDSELARIDQAMQATEGKLVQVRISLEKNHQLLDLTDKPSRFIAWKITELESTVKALESDLRN